MYAIICLVFLDMVLVNALLAWPQELGSWKLSKILALTSRASSFKNMQKVSFDLMVTNSLHAMYSMSIASFNSHLHLCIGICNLSSHY